MLHVKLFTFNDFGENTLLITDPTTRQAIVVDPGMRTTSEQRVFDDFVHSNALTITQVVNTHMHLDHCFGASYVTSRYSVKLAASKADEPLAHSLADQMRRFGMFPLDGASGSVEIDIDLHDGDIISVGSGELRVIAVPGHTPGGIALYDEADGFVVAGDSLFRRSIGRTDLPGGNHQQLVENVRGRLLSLPPDTVVIPGHGPITTVGEELRANPFI